MTSPTDSCLQLEFVGEEHLLPAYSLCKGVELISDGARAVVMVDLLPQFITLTQLKTK